MAAGLVFSPTFGIPQSIKARTVLSCLEVVANAINRVPAAMLSKSFRAGRSLLTYIGTYRSMGD